ncbi:HAMP domain-containing histidine kinase [Luteimonas fraxinea]|uniref:histidine kinase n=1 Tax=Luteimonas fraxinea TaxID=2901869 RepID=A0ABS8UE06_9GAMM|nr:HAMP domain-containing sensor histidine kinase [Luteimonas fraxinea]MCD9097479.1 HAMP domain-containing histidine kinase [Luteimonas fraxinea]MCD9124963.1 HAMP domain-containing histidine kinase [Luteimonas fraxinea]UHH11732.1 HAMP domain-containing histidine kinase [Luteimonas fraxinea]
MPNSANASGRILVVDDQPANLRVVSSLLSRHGYEVQTAPDGAEALAMLEARQPDLLLLDMLMPNMDGFALLAEIKQNPDLLRLPVVFLTVAQDRELLLRAFDAGAVDYVTKPFMPEELLARVNAHVGLKQTRDRLERIARERQELVNLVAHDLKNPLSSIWFASDMLVKNETKPERIPRYHKMIHESAEDALGYIRRYLETQDTSRKAAEAAQSTGLRDVLDWIVARYAMQFEDRGVQLQARAPDAAPLVAIDGLVLRQVAENLITNAIKYAPDSNVDISLRGGGVGFWQLLVEDRGPGIARDQQHALFRPFQRLAHAGKDDGRSSGLGLSLAKQIIVDLGGQLWYEDREGGGARFIIELPQMSAEAERPAANDDPQDDQT